MLYSFIDTDKNNNGTLNRVCIVFGNVEFYGKTEFYGFGIQLIHGYIFCLNAPPENRQCDKY